MPLVINNGNYNLIGQIKNDSLILYEDRIETVMGGMISSGGGKFQIFQLRLGAEVLDAMHSPCQLGTSLVPNMTL